MLFLPETGRIPPVQKVLMCNVDTRKEFFANVVPFGGTASSGGKDMYARITLSLGSVVQPDSQPKEFRRPVPVRTLHGSFRARKLGGIMFVGAAVKTMLCAIVDLGAGS